MENWEKFEKECTEYLNGKYKVKTGCEFKQSGGHNSHEPDIQVYKEGKEIFSIEIKMANAQCGQFVIFPQDDTQTFSYSDRNEFQINEHSKAIIKEMQKKYFNYNKPSTRAINCDKMLFYNWVKHHYKNDRGSKFLITKGDNYVVFDIDEFEKYFDISAVYRIKKSGSKNPSSKELIIIKELLESSSMYFQNLTHDGTYVRVSIYGKDYDKTVLKAKNRDYYLKHISGNEYKITALSNTYNANVIFSISLKQEQDLTDLRTFEASLK